ncbi:MAG: hypothetical protein ABSF21_00510 [Dehalococcoidia bacterium]
MKGLVKGQKGQALVVALIVLVVGSLILTPLLGLMGTGIKSGQVFEQKDDETYAADAGVEDAMWHIRNNNPDDDNLLREVLGTGYNPYDYSSSYSYPYRLLVNGKNVTVTMQNIWIPSSINIDGTTPSQLNQTISNEKLIIVGYPGSTPSTYTIKIVWQGTGTALKVKTLGVWLCSGFEYDGLDGNQLPSGSPSPSINLSKGGTAVVWNFASQPSLSTFPFGGSGPPMVKTITFKYKGPAGQIPELVASWIDTTGVSGITYTWDDSIRLYKIVSKAGAVEIDAYGAKTKFRKLKSAVSGDYFGTGNSLIGGNLNPPTNYHYQLYRSTSATVATNDNDDTAGIPSDATIDAAYLYWTGWIDWNTYHPSGSGSQIRYPSGDISNSGTWARYPSGTNWYSYVNEQGAHDGDTRYLLHGTTAGYMLFSFAPFTVNVPTDMEIGGLTVSLVARDNTSGANTMRPWIRVGGSSYYGDYTEVPTSYGTISYTWTENPRTSQPWTKDQINGIGSNHLESFGVTSDDASPQIRLTQVYATVDWGASLKYPADPTQEALQVLVENTARVNRVYFKGGSSADTLVTTHDWQTLYPDAFKDDSSPYQWTWYYTCKADVTDLLKGWIGNGTIGSNGAGTYTLSHVAAPNEASPGYSFSFASGGGSTGYPLGTPSPSSIPNPPGDYVRYSAAHAGWSLLILYSCASVYNHQYYLYDIDTPGFTFFCGWSGHEGSTVDPDWDNDGSAGGTVSGFLVPAQSPGETNAARITVMVGEGDKSEDNADQTKDRFKVKSPTGALTALPDGTIYPDVWNGNSRQGLSVDGIDIDHFYITWASGILKPFDVSLEVHVPTNTDLFTMSYMLLQFRSELGPGGVITNYAIRIG